MTTTKFKIAAFGLLLMTFLTSCQMKWPFNNANDKLRTVAVEQPIAANEEMVVGEFNEKPYRVLVDNQSEAVLQCYIVDKKTNEWNEHLVVKPKEEITLYAADYEKLIIQNRSKTGVNIKMGFDKNHQGFRYQDLTKFE